MDFSDMFQTTVNNPAGLLGAIAAFLAAGYAVLKKFSRSEKVSDASAGSHVDQIDRLTILLAAADKRTEQAYERETIANKRADTAYHERNELMLKMGQMSEQIAALTREVAQVAPLRDEIHRLNTEVASLRKQLNQ